MTTQKTEGTFPSTSTGSVIHYTRWQPAEGEPRGLLLIAHGMAEHIGRYDAFARFMAAEGIAVYGNDHLGHGRSAAASGDFGYMAAQNGHLAMIEDMGRLLAVAQGEHPGRPAILLGHSMGSFIARGFCAMHPEALAGAIFMGTAGPNPMARPGIALNRLLSAVKGSKAHSKLFDSMTTGNFNRAVKNPRTSADWITTDAAEVDKYLADAWSGFPFTLSGYRDLLSLMVMVSAPDWAAKLRKDMPVLLIAGAEDPVGDNGAGVRIVEGRLREAGQSDLRMILYEGMRHEILNEQGRERVYADLLGWCNEAIGRAGVSFRQDALTDPR